MYTKVRDEAPVRYAMDCKVHNSVVADGCIIEGEVENCVLFRGVRVAKGRQREKLRADAGHRSGTGRGDGVYRHR